MHNPDNPVVRFNDFPKLEHLKQQNSGLVNYRWTLRHRVCIRPSNHGATAGPGSRSVGAFSAMFP